LEVRRAEVIQLKSHLGTRIRSGIDLMDQVKSGLAFLVRPVPGWSTRGGYKSVQEINHFQ